MATFQQIDDVGDDVDKPYNAALLQDVANNVEAVREKRLRKASVVYDARQPPRICGCYTTGNTDELSRVFLAPILWERSSVKVNEITVRIRYTVQDDTVDFGIFVLPARDQWRRDRPDNATTNTLSTTATISTNSQAVTVDEHLGRDLAIFLTFKSKTTGAATSPWVQLVAVDSYYATCSNIVSPITTDTVPCYSIEAFDKVGPTGFSEGQMPAPRQLIRVEDPASGADQLVVYPPWSERRSDASAFDVDITKLSSLDLYSIEIEETGIENIPSIGSAFNPGATDSATAAREHLYKPLQDVWATHTRVHHIGATPRVDTVDPSFTTQPLNPFHGFEVYSTTEKVIDRCVVGASHYFDLAGTDKAITGYRVQAIFCVAYIGDIGRAFDLDITLKLRTLAGTLRATGVKRRYRVLGCNFASYTSIHGALSEGMIGADPDYSHPLGVLLRLHHPKSAASTSDTQPNLFAHALLGTYPEDVWHQGDPGNRSDKGSVIYYDEVISDTEDVDNEGWLEIVVDGTEDISGPESYIHLLTWTCTTVQIDNAVSTVITNNSADQ